MAEKGEARRGAKAPAGKAAGRTAAGKAKTGARRPAARTAPQPLRLSPRDALALARRWLIRAVLGLAGLVLALIVLYRFVDPPTTPYILSERLRLGHVDRTWTPLRGFAPVMARSVVAAEDANFCRHWGFDIAAIRAAAEAGGARGGSTIDQQVVKNLFLWQGHSWLRKALEALIVPVAEIVWPKRRFLEFYLNIAETGTGTFGFTDAAAKAFHVEPGRITPHQAALLASVLPDPEARNAAKPSHYLRERAQSVEDGAATIAADGRADCFEPPAH